MTSCDKSAPSRGHRWFSARVPVRPGTGDTHSQDPTLLRRWAGGLLRCVVVAFVLWNTEVFAAAPVFDEGLDTSIHVYVRIPLTTAAQA